jgi:hypothetical protein
LAYDSRNDSSRDNHLFRIRHLHFKNAYKRRYQRPQLRLRKTLPNTAARAMQKRHYRVVIRRPIRVIEFARVGIDPAVWIKVLDAGISYGLESINSSRDDKDHDIREN